MLARAVLSQAVAFISGWFDATRELGATVRLHDRRRAPFLVLLYLAASEWEKSADLSVSPACASVLYGRARVARCIIHVPLFPTV